MELSERRKQILTTIVQTYVQTGEPVGSKTLCDTLGGISSATIRNEMGFLAENGYLTQPHTSAGRIPTNRAYRLYIDNLMPKKLPGDGVMAQIREMMPDPSTDGERAIYQAVQALSKATGCAALFTVKADEGTLIHKVELIPMAPNRALVVIVTSSGAVVSRAYNFALTLTSDLISRFVALAEENLVGQELSSIQPATLQTVVARAGQYALELTEPIAALGEIIEELASAKLQLVGETRLLSHPGVTLSKAHELFELFSRGDEVLAMLDAWDKESGVILGGDTAYTALDRSSLILAKYAMGTTSGYIGIIGPTRMNYEKLLPCIYYFARLLGEFNSDQLKGMI